MLFWFLTIASVTLYTFYKKSSGYCEVVANRTNMFVPVELHNYCTTSVQEYMFLDETFADLQIAWNPRCAEGTPALYGHVSSSSGFFPDLRFGCNLLVKPWSTICMRTSLIWGQQVILYDQSIVVSKSYFMISPSQSASHTL